MSLYRQNSDSASSSIVVLQITRNDVVTRHLAACHLKQARELPVSASLRRRLDKRPDPSKCGNFHGVEGCLFVCACGRLRACGAAPDAVATNRNPIDDCVRPHTESPSNCSSPCAYIHPDLNQCRHHLPSSPPSLSISQSHIQLPTLLDTHPASTINVFACRLLLYLAPHLLRSIRPPSHPRTSH